MASPRSLLHHQPYGPSTDPTAQEIYEPLWDEILHRSKQNGFAIRSIWVADVSHQGASGVLNEYIQGNDRNLSLSPSPSPSISSL